MKNPLKNVVSLCILLSATTIYASSEFFNMAYVEVNDHSLSNAMCYVREGTITPFINMVSIFAANINGDEPNHPVIYFNPQVDAILNNSNQVSMLQQHGVKVLLTILGNHQNAGWACMTDEKAINSFANEVVDTVNKYHLDGIDIDDEYSRCVHQDTSLVRIAQAIKSHPRFKNKILSKALFRDTNDFTAEYQGHKLADYLDYGWEMSYGSTNFEYRLRPYIANGMSKEKLSLGVSVNHDGNISVQAVTYLQKHAYPGLMIYNLGKNSFTFLSTLSQIERGETIEILPDCLQ